MQPYQALYTIAEAYYVSVDRILLLNGLQADWPLQIGQKFVISPGNITPSPTLSNIQKLIPAADGKYDPAGNSDADPSPETITFPPIPSITPPPAGTPPADIVRATRPPRKSGSGVVFVVLTIVIGGLLWWRFSRKS